jgi:hypothetical protein
VRGDKRLRALERAYAGGDLEAGRQLRLAQLRRGSLDDEGLRRLDLEGDRAAALAMGIGPALRRLEAWLAEHAPGVLAELRPGASQRELAQAEEALGRPLPGSLRELLAWRDGQGEDCGHPLYDGQRLIPSAAVAECARAVALARAEEGTGSLIPVFMELPKANDDEGGEEAGADSGPAANASSPARHNPSEVAAEGQDPSRPTPGAVPPPPAPPPAGPTESSTEGGDEDDDDDETNYQSLDVTCLAGDSGGVPCQVVTLNVYHPTSADSAQAGGSSMLAFPSLTSLLETYVEALDVLPRTELDEVSADAALSESGSRRLRLDSDAYEAFVESRHPGYPRPVDLAAAIASERSCIRCGGLCGLLCLAAVGGMGYSFGVHPSWQRGLAGTCTGLVFLPLAFFIFWMVWESFVKIRTYRRRARQAGEETPP